MLNTIFKCENPMNRLVAMIAAKNFGKDTNMISFRFCNSKRKHGKKSVNHVKFYETETGYRIVLGRIFKEKMFGISIDSYEEIITIKDVKDPKTAFEQATGLYTSL
ncbi:MAG: hypothetical protein [Caudoviricetes sp.]|nr:MAG: hypothetical protein [Caudoviricetes sp.]